MGNKGNFRSRLLLMSALSGLLPFAMPLAANAQAAPAAKPKSDIPEVIVTAQRRAENVQKASVSVDVISANTLAKAGISQAVDLNRITPGVQVAPGGTALQIYIRGAGDFTTTAYSNAAVSQNFDGVAAGRTQFIAGTFFDLARVEILKGPQGTLYGRNATGGALNLIPVEPKLGRYGGYIQGSIQNYNGVGAEGAVNIPIGDKAAFRGSFQLASRDGYIKSNGTEDDKHESARLQYLYAPTENVTMRLLADYQHLGGKGPGLVAYEPNGTQLIPTPYVPADPWTSVDYSVNANIDMLPTGSATAPAPNRNTVAHIDSSKSYQDVKVFGLIGHLDWNLGFGTLTVIPGYQDVSVASEYYPTFRYLSYNPVTGDPQTSKTKSLEVRLGNNSDKVKWVVGAFYFNEDQYTISDAPFGTFNSTIFEANLTTDSTALFGEVTYSVTPKLRTITGLRYTEESKTVLADQWAAFGSNACLTASTASNAGPGGACFSGHIDKDYAAHRTNYHLGLEYDLTAQNMLFATIATGFKSGGQTNALLPSYKPEDLTAYTLGSRNRFFGRKLQVNAELFYIDYLNHQENVSRLDQNGNPVSSLTNAGSAVSKGVSLDTIVRPTTEDTVRLAVEYDEGYYKEFTYLAYRSPPSVGCPFTNNNTTPLASFTVVCDGFQMTRTPLWSGSVTYTHEFDLANGASVEISPDLTFASSRWVEPTFSPNSRAAGYTLYNLNATYTPPNGKFTVQAFVRNISNVAVYTGGQQRPQLNRYVGMNIGAPRTYGIRVRASF